MLRSSDRLSLDALLEANDLVGVPEEPFPNDGWSGAALTLLRRPRDGARFVLKRTSLHRDWIARATNDHDLRESLVASLEMPGPQPVVLPYLGAARDGDGAAILMPDLSAELIAWERPGADPVLDPTTLDRVLEAVAGFHVAPWPATIAVAGERLPWCPVRERILLLSRPSAERYRRDGRAVGDRFLVGWDAFDRTAPPAARSLITSLSADPTPLLAALGRLPATGLHGDLKLSNVALLDGGLAGARVGLIDWQMVCRAPVAVELGWLCVSNSAALPFGPEEMLNRYRGAAETAAHGAAEATLGDWPTQQRLATIVGLLLRGWRKGLDAEAGLTLGSGVSAVDDLRWWSDEAVDAAHRQL